MKGCVALLVVLGIWLSGWTCSGEEPAPPKPEEPAVTPVPMPPKAKVLDWQELVKFVPKPPKAWKAVKPKGQTQSMGPFATSKVTAIFTKGPQRIEFVIDDFGTINPLFSMEEPWTVVEKDTPEQLTKKLMLGKVLAEETFFKNKKQGVVLVMFEKRIQLNITGWGIDDTSLLVEMVKKVKFEDLKKALAEKSK